MSTNLPHHLSESTFRVYEPYLALGVKNFPDETSWDVGVLRATNPDWKIGPVTFIARFRDSIVSLRRFHWKTTVDVEKLISIAGQFSIALQPGTSIVWFKNRGVRARPLDLVVEARAHVAAKGSSPSAVPWRDATLAEIEALCVLLHHERVKGPFLLTEELTAAQVEHFTSIYNVAFMWDAERKVMVVT